jgi:hypothetical protein
MAGRKCSCHPWCLGRVGGLRGSGGQHNSNVKLTHMLNVARRAVPATVYVRPCVLLSADQLNLHMSSHGRPLD